MKAFIFDTETTDLIKNTVVPLDQQPKIIEFYGHIVDTVTGETLRELEFLCNPGHKLEAVTTKITGLTDDDLANAPPFSIYEGDVRSILADAEAMVAHNLSYDYTVVSAEMERCGTLSKVKWPMRRICTVQETEWVHGHRMSLSALHEYLFGEPFSGAHRAKVDVQALTRCFLELIKRGDL